MTLLIGWPVYKRLRLADLFNDTHEPIGCLLSLVNIEQTRRHRRIITARPIHVNFRLITSSENKKLGPTQIV